MTVRKVTVPILMLLVGTGFGAWLSVDGSSPAGPDVRLETRAGATIIDITVPGVQVETRVVDGVEYSEVRLPGEPGSTSDIGRPELPRIIRNLGIPTGSRVSVELLDVEQTVFTDIMVYPRQKPTTDEQEEPFTIDRGFYAEDVVYPEQHVTVDGQAVWRGLELAGIGISPVTCNPAKRELVVCTRLRVRVTHPGVMGRMSVEPWMARMYGDYVDNFGALNLDIGWSDSPGVRYLVIAHDNYPGSWLDTLVNWHHKCGIETRVISKSSWTAAEVKDSIRAEYDSHTPPVLRWALLMGKPAEVPTGNWNVNVSDVWYGALEPATPDHYLEVGIGRLTPDSLGDLANQIGKIMLFSRNPPTTNDWLTKAALCAHQQQYPGKYSECSRGIFNFPYGYYRYDFDTIFGGVGANNADLKAAIEEGRAVVNYRGHGSQTAWTGWTSSDADWTTGDVHALTNGNLTPVVINCACNCHQLNGSSLGEEWMSKYPGGAVASLGATEPSMTIPNHGWDSSLFRALGDTFTIQGVRDYTAPLWDLGGMLNYADAYLAKYYNTPGELENVEMYLALGDPAMNIWTGHPTVADVTYPPAVPLGPYDLTVTVTTLGSPVEGALVCAWKPGEFYEFGYTNGSGGIILPINASSPGDFSVTVTGHTLLPHEGTSLARTTGTAYVTYLRHTVDDSAGGNNDGSVNPGETINMPTWVKNHGDSTAHGLTGTIRTGDAYITLTDSAKSFGDLPAHDSASTGVDGYEFEVAVACTNGHWIHFDMECKDATDSSWFSHIYLRVGAPSLRYAGLHVIDTLGNGNGRLDPEETAELEVSLRNVGFGHALGVTAVLVSGDTRMVVNDSFGDFGTILAESTGTNAGDLFRVTTLSMPLETSIPCTLHVSAAGGFTQVIDFSIIVGEVRAVDPIPDTGGPATIYWAYDDCDTFYTEHPEFAWVEISGTGTQLSLSDDQTIEVNLPTGFGPFVYYGQSYTQISVCSNGFVAPGSESYSAYTNLALPCGAAPPMLAMHWDDLYPPDGGGVWYYHDAANHRFIVEWDSVEYWNTSTWDKHQVILYDTTLAAADGNCEFTYQYLSANRVNTSTNGCQNQTKTIYIQALFDGAYHRGSSPIVPGRAIKFTSDGPIVGVSERGVQPSRIPTRLALSVAPNPFRGAAALHWQLPTPGAVKLSVYDVTGRSVRTLVRSEMAAGRYNTAWDGRDDQGRLVAHGTYVYKLETGAGVRTTKAVMLR